MLYNDGDQVYLESVNNYGWLGILPLNDILTFNFKLCKVRFLGDLWTVLNNIPSQTQANNRIKCETQRKTNYLHSYRV